MYCILIAGMPCSGKSTFAEYLSKKSKLPYMSKDIIKEKLYDTVGFKSREEKNNLGLGAMEILYYFAEEEMKTGNAFIIENNFENVSNVFYTYEGDQIITKKSAINIWKICKSGSSLLHPFFCCF